MSVFGFSESSLVIDEFVFSLERDSLYIPYGFPLSALWKPERYLLLQAFYRMSSPLTLPSFFPLPLPPSPGKNWPQRHSDVSGESLNPCWHFWLCANILRILGILFLNWSIVNLLCCVTFMCTANWFCICKHAHIYSFSDSFSL